MKKTKWFRTLGLADEKYIAEADPSNKVKKPKVRWVVSLVAACLCLCVVGGGLWLFMPFNTDPPSVAKYSDSEYYELIKKLNEFTFDPPKYKNNAQKLKNGIENMPFWYKAMGDGMAWDDAVADYISSPSESEYREITDNQVEGIIEADRIKRSQTHIYYLDGEVLRVYSIDKENTKEVASYKLYGDDDDYRPVQWEFYLSADCRTVTVITQCYQVIADSRCRCVKLISLDVTDPEDISLRGEFTVTGDYMSSRLTDGGILLMTEFVIDKSSLDFEDEGTFVPQINEGAGFYVIPAGEIIAPESVSNSRYTIVTKLDADTLEFVGTAAYLSYSEDVYVSADHVYLMHVFAEFTELEDGSSQRNTMTEIAVIDYGGEEFGSRGSATVRGYVKDQWSMDELDGILRVVTTTNATTVSKTYAEGATVSASIMQTATGKSSASLYCIDLSSFEVVASVEDFAPPYEEVQSVRFDGNAAYVCTSIERSDPVFFFDLSDLSNITYKDTGTIEGFSTSLINIGDGYLLGIGSGGGWREFKAEVYEETADGVRSVCSFVCEDTDYSEEYKSYYIDRENKFVGMGIERDGESRYILLCFDGYELELVAEVPLAGDPSVMRGVYIDGYMYMFGSCDFAVKKIFS